MPRCQCLSRGSLTILAPECLVQEVESSTKLPDSPLDVLCLFCSPSCAGHFHCKYSTHFVHKTIFLHLEQRSVFSVNMRSFAIISFAALALAGPLNPQVEEGDKALAALKDVSPDDASAVQMVSEDQRQDLGTGEILAALQQTSPDVGIP